MDSGSASKIAGKRLAGDSLFTGAGRAKSRQELSQNVERIGNELATSSSISNAFGKIDQRFRADISTAASDLNRRESQIKQVESDLKAEGGTLNSLKLAFESSNPSEVQQLRSELEDLRLTRADRQAQIELEQRVAGSVRRVSVDKNEQESINLPEIRVSKVQAELPVNKKQTEQQIEAVQADLAGIKDLQEPLELARSQLSEIYKSGQKSSDRVGQSSVEGIFSAQALALNIADSAKLLSDDELISSVFSKTFNINSFVY